MDASFASHIYLITKSHYHFFDLFMLKNNLYFVFVKP